MLDCFTEDYAEATKWSEKTIRYCRQREYSYWTSAALSVSGRCLADVGEIEKAITQLKESLSMVAATEGQVVEPLYRGHLAEMLLFSGDSMTALDEIQAALLQIDKHGITISRPDLMRIRGLALFQLGSSEDAEAALRESIDISRTMSCRYVELRAAIELARLIGDLAPLKKICASFGDEVNEPPVLRRARKSLQKLEGGLARGAYQL